MRLFYEHKKQTLWHIKIIVLVIAKVVKLEIAQIVLAITARVIIVTVKLYLKHQKATFILVTLS